MSKLTADDLDLAFRAAEFRKEFDALLTKHNCRLQLGWGGKWAYLQLVWPDNHAKALTLAKVQKGGKLRVITEAEEMSAETERLSKKA